jgi:hypothetical protein
MIISIMKNIDLSALVSIANDPVENEVDGIPTTTLRPVEEEIDTTEKPIFTLGQILTGDTAFSTVETKVLEAEPVSTLPSVENPTTEVRRDESQLTTTTNDDDEANTAANVRVEDGVHVVLPVGWFENEEDRKHNAETATAPVVEETTTTTTTTAATTGPVLTTTSEAETAADILTTIPAEIPNITEEKIATTQVENEESSAAEQVTTVSSAAEQLTTVSNEVVEIVHAEGVSPTTVASSEVEITLTTTNAVTTDIPETVRGGKKLPRVFRPRSRTSTTSSTTAKSTTTEDEAAEDGEERPRFANQRNRIRQRLRSQFTGSTSATKALEILNTRAKSEQKEQKEQKEKAEDAAEVEVEAEEGSGDEEQDDKTSPKIKKDRTKLNVPKLVDRRNELFKKRVPITHSPLVDSTAAASTESAPAVAAAKPIFRNPSRRPFKLTQKADEAVIPSELTATESVSSTPSPDSDSAKPKSVRCRLFRRACTDEDLSTTTTKS